MIAAIEARDLGPAVALAESVDRDKEQLKAELRALGAAFARAARADMAGAHVAALRYAAVARAVTHLERNASPTLAMSSLIAEVDAERTVIEARLQELSRRIDEAFARSR